MEHVAVELPEVFGERKLALRGTRRETREDEAEAPPHRELDQATLLEIDAGELLSMRHAFEAARQAVRPPVIRANQARPHASAIRAPR